MYYLTKHNLSWSSDKYDICDLNYSIAAWMKRNKFSGLNYAFDERGNDLGYVAWYKWCTDMKHMSSAFPDASFVLNLESETGYKYVIYFIDGVLKTEDDMRLQNEQKTR